MMFHHSILHQWPQWLLLSIFASCSWTASAVIVEHATDVLEHNYDFIIVGGGTAGLTVANRLTENPSYSVLVIEAGGSNEDVFYTKIPFFNRRNFKTSADWNYTTEPMSGLGGRSIDYPQGHILGGTSSINGMVYSRGSSDDYNRYAKLTNDPGWSWDKIQVYLRKNEHWSAPADHHNTTGEFNPSVHGYHGINSVSLPGFVYPFDHRVMRATSELPDEFPFNLDINSGHPIGIGWGQFTIKDGERSSSATSYLAPRFANRHNLHVLLNSRVSRVFKTGYIDGLPSFNGVEIAEPSIAKRIRLTAKKEVILSSGVVGTPTILLHSGIGDSELLSSVGVEPLVHLPSVGQNLTDHPFVGNSWLVNSTDTFESAFQNATLMAEQINQWNETRTGPYAAFTFNIVGWLRMPDNASIFQGFSDPSAGPNAGHFEVVISNGQSRPPLPTTGHYMVIGTVVSTPLSRGNVTIKSNNIFDPPSINPNFLDSDFDMVVMREAIRSVRKFAQAPAFSDYILSLVNTATSDDELSQFIRSSAVTVSHGVGTAAMSPKGAEYGVVDPDLRVKTVSGLRVVDASVLPMVPAAHTQVATYVVAERGADLIKLRGRTKYT